MKSQVKSKSNKIAKKKIKKKTVDRNEFMEINCSYLDPVDISKTLLEVGENDLTIFQNNIRSLNKNFHLVEEIFYECNKRPDILSFSETRLKPDSICPSLEGYSFHHVDSLTDCGGVGVFISDKIDFTIRNDLSINSEDCEDIWVEISLKNKNRKNIDEKLVIGNIYRHPKQNYMKFSENLCKLLENLNKSKTSYVLVGDINIDILKYSLASNVTNYINSIVSVGCNFHVDKPTRVTRSSSSCIDHVYSNLSHIS